MQDLRFNYFPSVFICIDLAHVNNMSSIIEIEIEGKELKQVLHFLFSFEPRISEVDKSLFLAPPLRTTSCNVHYSGSI
jgi:hypothetical protein